MYITKYTGSLIDLFMFSKAISVSVAHEKYRTMQYVADQKKRHASATSRGKEVATLDPCVIQLCKKLENIFADPGISPDLKIIDNIILKEGSAPLKSVIYFISPVEYNKV